MCIILDNLPRKFIAGKIIHELVFSSLQEEEEEEEGNTIIVERLRGIIDNTWTRETRGGEGGGVWFLRFVDFLLALFSPFFSFFHFRFSLSFFLISFSIRESFKRFLKTFVVSGRFAFVWREISGRRNNIPGGLFENERV